MLLLPVLAIDHAFDSVSTVCHAEVDEQADPDAADLMGETTLIAAFQQPGPGAE